jgi:BlaI family transcriptional regulator, penicillinase repressor
MGDKRAIRLTKLEMEIMEALWDLGSASIREILERLPEKKRPAYTTVQTIVRRLEEKGAVRLIKQIGNAYIFEPLVTRDAAHSRLIDELLDILGGSALPLMAHLAEAGKLSLEEVREIEMMLSDKSDQEASADKSGSPRQAISRSRRKDRA